MRTGKALSSLVLMLSLFGIVAAAGEGSQIVSGICELFTLVNTVLVAVIFLLIVGAAVVYAGGQLLGAETRARATVWATSMFIGAMIGVLIYVIAPMVLGLMMYGAPASMDQMTVACGGEVGASGGSGGGGIVVVDGEGPSREGSAKSKKCGAGCTGTYPHCVCVR